MCDVYGSYAGNACVAVWVVCVHLSCPLLCFGFVFADGMLAWCVSVVAGFCPVLSLASEVKVGECGLVFAVLLHSRCCFVWLLGCVVWLSGCYVGVFAVLMLLQGCIRDLLYFLCPSD